MFKNKKIHRAWFVLFTLIAIQSGIYGILINCIGMIFSSIILDLGFKAGDLSIYYTIRSIVTALAIAPMVNLFLKYNSRIVMSVLGTLATIAYVSMSFFTELWQWYVAAVIAGLAISCIVVIIPIVVSNWFNTNNGLLIGIALSASGAAGAIVSPICASIITSHGWRVASIVLGVFIFVLTVIPSALFLDMEPKKLGLEPFGVKKALKDGFLDIEKKKPPKSTFVICALIMILMNIIVQFANQLGTFANSIGFDTQVAGVMISLCMIGNVVGKFIVGALADIIGIFKARQLATIAILFSLVVFLTSGSVYPIYAASLMYGFIYAVTTGSPSLLYMSIYGEVDYKKVLSKIQSIASLLGAIISLAIPYIYDFTGSYNLFFMISIVLVCVSFVGMLYLEKKHG